MSSYFDSEYLKFDIENDYFKNNKCRRCLISTYATVSGNTRKCELQNGKDGKYKCFLFYFNLHFSCNILDSERQHH